VPEPNRNTATGSGSTKMIRLHASPAPKDGFTQQKWLTLFVSEQLYCKQYNAVQYNLAAEFLWFSIKIRLRGNAEFSKNFILFSHYGCIKCQTYVAGEFILYWYCSYNWYFLKFVNSFLFRMSLSTCSYLLFLNRLSFLFSYFSCKNYVKKSTVHN
jgi:hypothetical protein